jgi:hypothetical protein
MPWKVVQDTAKGQWCVHKMNADGSMGAVVHCHDTPEEAAAQARALYASEADGKKSLSFTKIIREVDNAWQTSQPHSADGLGPGWVQDVSADQIIVQAHDGYYRVPWSRDEQGNVTFGERTKVDIEYVPTKAGLLIHKQADGAYRWVGWVSNHYRDNDTPKEIISGAAHKEFVAHADATGEYPELWLWHVPGSKVGKADWLEFADGFLLSSGTFDSPALAESLAKSGDPLTMSHGFVRLKHDKAEVVTDAYRMLEASVTPQGAEANQWTRFATQKEATPMPISEAKKAFLAKYLPPETLKAIEDNTTELRKAAEAAGVDWKDVEAAETVAIPSAETPAEEPKPAVVDANAIAEAAAALIIERLQVKELSATIASLTEQMKAVGTLTAQVQALEATVKALKATDDAKIAATMTPKAMEGLSLAWANKAASKRADTIVDEAKPGDKALTDSRPFLAQLAEQLTAKVASGR